MAKRQTNQQFLKALLNESAYGPLVELFVLDSILKIAEAAAVVDPRTLDNFLISGDTWQAVATETRDKVRSHLGMNEIP